MRGLRCVMAGLLVAGLVVVAGAQPGGGFGGGGNRNPLFLVNNKAVQEDLKMTDEQVEKVKDLGKDLFPKLGEMMKDAGIEFKGGGKGGFGKIDPEMAEKMADVNNKFNKMAYDELGKALKPEQVTRLKQIQHQAAGVNAFSDPEVAKDLKLTDEQKTKIKGISTDFTKDSAEIRKGAFGGGKGGFDKEKMAEANKKIEKLQKEAMVRVEEVLTSDQKETWKKLTGPAFDTSKLTGGFGFGKKDKE